MWPSDLCAALKWFTVVPSVLPSFCMYCSQSGNVFAQLADALLDILLLALQFAEILGLQDRLKIR